MNLTVASTAKDKPKGKGAGRTELPIWQEVAAAIQAQPAGEWVTYTEFEGTSEAIRVGLRLRAKDSFAEGKAFAPLKDKVKVALTNVDKDKNTATLAILYTPKTAPQVRSKSPKK